MPRSIHDLAQNIAQLYPLRDKRLDKRYRIVDELAGTTELEEITGKPRYVSTQELQNQQFWELGLAC